MREMYTRHPRPVLWLVPEGRVARGEGWVEVAPFYLSTLPVTNAQFESFDPTFQRAAWSLEDSDPALGLSYRDALAYCSWYGRLARKAIRLPDEREWEHASGGLAAAREEQAWHRGNSTERVPRLEAKPPNELGIYGMWGGVWEWVAPLEDGRPMLRGGSWRSWWSEITATPLLRLDPGERHAEAGFRIARSLHG
jgi:formylglycine-generating enzyme required for sulfatase activity